MSDSEGVEVNKQKIGAKVVGRHRGTKSNTSRQTRLRSDRYNANVTKRGLVAPAAEEKETSKPAVSPILIGFLFFVLMGSTVFQIIRMAQSGPVF